MVKVFDEMLLQDWHDVGTVWKPDVKTIFLHDFVYSRLDDASKAWLEKAETVVIIEGDYFCLACNEDSYMKTKIDQKETEQTKIEKKVEKRDRSRSRERKPNGKVMVGRLPFRGKHPVVEGYTNVNVTSGSRQVSGLLSEQLSPLNMGPVKYADKNAKKMENLLHYSDFNPLTESCMKHCFPKKETNILQENAKSSKKSKYYVKNVTKIL
jgi:hypothetical protein